MLLNLGSIDEYIKEHTKELMWEAEKARLANEAVGPGRPIRMRLANWLHAMAARVEGAPYQPSVQPVVLSTR